METAESNGGQASMIVCDCLQAEPSYVGGLLRLEVEPPAPPCDLCGREGRCVVLGALVLCEEHFRGMVRDAQGWVEHLDEMAMWDEMADDGAIVVPYVPG